MESFGSWPWVPDLSQSNDAAFHEKVLSDLYPECLAADSPRAEIKAIDTHEQGLEISQSTGHAG